MSPKREAHADPPKQSAAYTNAATLKRPEWCATQRTVLQLDTAWLVLNQCPGNKFTNGCAKNVNTVLRRCKCVLWLKGYLCEMIVFVCAIQHSC